jgi:predicted nucleotidyltransferase
MTVEELLAELQRRRALVLEKMAGGMTIDSVCEEYDLTRDDILDAQSAAYYLDTDEHVIAFVKNADLGFAIPYLHHDQSREYVPDFVARLRRGAREVGTLILETKDFDPLTHAKVSAAQRWVAAVNTEGSYGRWAYRIVTAPAGVPVAIRSAARELSEPARPSWSVALGKFVEEVKTAYGPRVQSVVLYGSRARGDAEPSSDVDVLVVFAPGEDARGERHRLGEIAARVSAEHDYLISALPADAEEFRTGDRPLIVNARAEGTVVS